MEIFEHLKHQLKLTSGEVKINTKGFAKDFSEIENELIYQDSELLIRYSKYPNGFEVLFIQESDKIRTRSNYPLIEVSNGQYEVKFD